MTVFADDNLLPDRGVIEITEVMVSKNTPYLFLSISKGNNIKIFSTIDEEFYEAYMKAIKKVESGRYQCDERTKKLLDMGIEKIYEKYNYPEEVYNAGMKSYIYKKITKQAQYAKKMQEISLYDWKDDWVNNLKTLGCEFYTTRSNNFYVKIEKKKKKLKVITWDGLNFNATKFYIVNAYFSMLIGDYLGNDQKVVYTFLNTDKEDAPDLEYPFVTDIEDRDLKLVAVDKFDIDTVIFTRQLLLPYDDFIKEMDKYPDYDEIEMLDYLCEVYSYPRFEIKRRMVECKMIREKETEKDTTGDKQLKKSLLRRLLGF